MNYNLILLCGNIEMNESFFGGLLQNGITILIALIAGIIALFQVKSNIVSSSRIKWIENLRLSISEFYEASLTTALFIQNNRIFKIEGKDKEFDEGYKNYISSHSKFFILSNRIKMYLNPVEDEHKNLEILINKVELLLDHKHTKFINQDNVELELKKIVEISRAIFKKEWDKSKKVFRI